MTNPIKLLCTAALAGSASAMPTIGPEQLRLPRQEVMEEHLAAHGSCAVPHSVPEDAEPSFKDSHLFRTHPGRFAKVEPPAIIAGHPVLYAYKVEAADFKEIFEYPIPRRLMEPVLKLLSTDEIPAILEPYRFAATPGSRSVFIFVFPNPEDASAVREVEERSDTKSEIYQVLKAIQEHLLLEMFGTINRHSRLSISVGDEMQIGPQAAGSTHQHVFHVHGKSPIRAHTMHLSGARTAVPKRVGYYPILTNNDGDAEPNFLLYDAEGVQAQDPEVYADYTVTSIPPHLMHGSPAKPCGPLDYLFFYDVEKHNQKGVELSMDDLRFLFPPKKREF